MTVKEKLVDYLDQHAFFPAQSNAIIQLLVDDKELTRGMAHAWNKDASSYPDAIFSALFVSLNLKVVEWIDKNAPEHFMRAHFAAR